MDYASIILICGIRYVNYMTIQLHGVYAQVTRAKVKVVLALENSKSCSDSATYQRKRKAPF